MPNITSVLERAAAEPAGPPDYDGPLRRRRARRVAVLGATGMLLATVAILAASAGSHRRATVVVGASQPTTTTTLGAPTSATVDGATISVEPGWFASSKPLAPWLFSPHELFSIATTPLDPFPEPGNQAACPSEIPRAAVDGIAADGAYLWIGEWRGGMYGAADPRPHSFSGVILQPGCTLPRGERSYLGLYHDGTHDYSVTYVVGPDAPPSRRLEIDRMLESFHFSS